MAAPCESSDDELSEADYATLRERCQTVPPAKGRYECHSFVSNLLLTVLDYQLHNKVVYRAHEHFRERHAARITTIHKLAEFLAVCPNDRDGNTAAAVELFGYKHWTRLQQLRGLVGHFLSIGVTDEEALRRWATQAEFKRDFKDRVKGLGPAVFQWLLMRLGVATVKPDVHVNNFVVDTLGYQPAFGAEIRALQRIAQEIGREPHELDLSIWELQRGGPGQI